MAIDPSIASRFDEAARRWEEEDDPPDVISGDMHSEPDSEPDADTDDTGGTMVLPEMDFSGPAPGQPIARLRAPTQTPSEPPPAVPPGPATAGAGQKAAPSVSPVGEPAASLDWAELGNRLRNAEMAKAQSQGYETLFANVGAQSGYRPNAHAGDVALNLAKQPLELAQAKQGYEARQAGLDKQRADASASAADKDPNSLASQKARESLRATGLKLPAGIDNWSAYDIKRFVNTGELTRLEASRAAAENARRDDQAKAAALAEKDAQAKRDLEGSRKAYARELKALGIDPTTASQKDIDRAISVGHNKATEEQAKATYALAASGEKRKASDYEALNQGIPFAGTELKYTGQGTPRAEDVNEAQKTSALYGAAIDGMDDLGSKIDAFAKNPSPATKDAVASAARIVGGHLNTAFGQGAMSKDEADAMSQVLGSDMRSAAGVQAFIDKITGDDAEAAKALTRKLKAARESTKASALGKLKAYRFAPSGSGDTVQMKFPNGKTIAVPRGDVEEARTKYKAVEVGG